MIYGIYDESNGKLCQVGNCPANVFAAQAENVVGMGVIELPLMSWDQWIDITTTPHTAMAKTAPPLTINKTTIEADGADECVITGIHNPSTVTWPDGFVETVTDGEVSFDVDLAGEYTFTIEAIPYMEEKINVVALA